MLRCTDLLLLSFVRIELKNNYSSASINLPMLRLFCSVQFSFNTSTFFTTSVTFFPLFGVPCLVGASFVALILLLSILSSLCLRCLYFLRPVPTLTVSGTRSHSMWGKSLELPPPIFLENFIFAVFLVESMPNVFEGVGRTVAPPSFYSFPNFSLLFNYGILMHLNINLNGTHPARYFQAMVFACSWQA